jgi:SAM-dependent methyltransferase
MTDGVSLPSEYFDRLYAADPDPWRFASSDYEDRKYAATLDALPERIGAAFEVGCSIGVLTRRLAARCRYLLAVDVAEAALAQARARCDGLDNIEFRKLRVPDQWPDGRFDAILLSEMLYYLFPDAIRLCAARARAGVVAGGVVLLVHYTRPTDYPCGGDEASEAFIAASGLTVTRQRREASFRLDLLRA